MTCSLTLGHFTAAKRCLPEDYPSLFVTMLVTLSVGDHVYSWSTDVTLDVWLKIYSYLLRQSTKATSYWKQTWCELKMVLGNKIEVPRMILTLNQMSF